MTHAPGLKLNAATANSASEYYKEVAKLDKMISSAIERPNSCSIWLRTDGGNALGWDGITTKSSMGQEIKEIILRRLYQDRARYQRLLAQLGFDCIEAPR